MENYEKKYKEVLEKAKALYKASEPMSGCNVIIETLFPELAESEDEKIRKWLICYFKEVCDNVSEKEKKGVLAWLEKQGEQKPTEWSEKTKGLDELETYILSIVPNRPLDAIKVDSKNIRFLINKEQKPTWSEEDEKMFEHIIAKATLHFSSINYLDEEEINFLKSLRHQPHWKPSEEQMDAINDAIDYLCGNIKIVRKHLMSLYEQLKKLKA